MSNFLLLSALKWNIRDNMVPESDADNYWRMKEILSMQLIMCLMLRMFPCVTLSMRYMDLVPPEGLFVFMMVSMQHLFHIKWLDWWENKNKSVKDELNKPHQWLCHLKKQSEQEFSILWSEVDLELEQKCVDETNLLIYLL